MLHLCLHTQQSHVLTIFTSHESAAYYKKRLLSSRLRAALLYGNTHKYLGGSLIPCPLSQTKAEDFKKAWRGEVRPPQLCGFHQDYSTMHGLLPVEQASEPMIKWLITPISEMPLLHCGDIFLGVSVLEHARELVTFLSLLPECL